MCHSEYWNPRYETMSRDELVALQNQRLSSQLHRAYEKNEYFRKKLDAHGVHPDDVRTIEDLPKLPFMTKDDFRQNYPLGMCLTIDLTAHQPSLVRGVTVGDSMPGVTLHASLSRSEGTL